MVASQNALGVNRCHFDDCIQHVCGHIVFWVPTFSSCEKTKYSDLKSWIYSLGVADVTKISELQDCSLFVQLRAFCQIFHLGAFQCSHRSTVFCMTWKHGLGLCARLLLYLYGKCSLPSSMLNQVPHHTETTQLKNIVWGTLRFSAIPASPASLWLSLLWLLIWQIELCCQI